MSGLYTKGLEQFGLAGINWESDTIQLAFMQTGYTPNYNTHAFWSDISASIASGTTRQSLSGLSVDIATDTVKFDSSNISVNNVTAVTNKVVLLKWTGVDATSTLIACLDINEGTLSPVDGTLSITVPANGFFALNSA